jgi:hypothetical protein
VHEGEGRFPGSSDTGYRDDIDAVVVIGIPFRHHRRVGAVSLEECASCGLDAVVLPGDENARVVIFGLFERVSQRILIRDADAHIDGQAKKYRGGLDCRERPDVIEAFLGRFYLLVRVWSENGVGSTESFGDD